MWNSFKELREACIAKVVFRKSQFDDFVGDVRRLTLQGGGPKILLESKTISALDSTVPPQARLTLRGMTFCRYEEALPLYEHALRILEKSLGPEHPDVSITLSNLAGLLKRQGRYVYLRGGGAAVQAQLAPPKIEPNF